MCYMWAELLVDMPYLPLPISLVVLSKFLLAQHCFQLSRSCIVFAHNPVTPGGCVSLKMCVLFNYNDYCSSKLRTLPTSTSTTLTTAVMTTAATTAPTQLRAACAVHHFHRRHHHSDDDRALRCVRRQPPPTHADDRDDSNWDRDYNHDYEVHDVKTTLCGSRVVT